MGGVIEIKPQLLQQFLAVKHDKISKIILQR